MSHFTLALDLAGNGPIIVAMVGVSEPRRVALLAAGATVPAPVAIRCLVDTGASMTCIDPIILVGSLALDVRTQIPCLTPTTGAAPEIKDGYDVSLQIYATSVGDPFLEERTLAVMGSDLFVAQGIHALIGRDILAKCFLMYNGTAKHFTMGF